MITIEQLKICPFCQIKIINKTNYQSCNVFSYFCTKCYTYSATDDMIEKYSIDYRFGKLLFYSVLVKNQYLIKSDYRNVTQLFDLKNKKWKYNYFNISKFFDLEFPILPHLENVVDKILKLQIYS